MRKEIKRFTLLDFYKDPTLMRKVQRKEWKSLGVKGATHIEKRPYNRGYDFPKNYG